jgi:hypothetical protein
MIINVIYDASVNNAPAGFKTAVAAAVQFYETTFTNPVTINLAVGYGEVNGKVSDLQTIGGDLGRSQFPFGPTVSYTQLLNALAAEGAPGLSSLPASSPTTMTLDMSRAEEKALGLFIDNTSTIDGSVGFSTTAPFDYDPNDRGVAGQYDFVGVVEHEISEVMGRLSNLNQSHLYAPVDLYRYSAAGVHQFGTGAPSYFSLDGGTTNLNFWNNFETGNTGDLADWAPSASPDSYLDNSGKGHENPVTATDILLMGALGWTTAGSAITAAIIQNDYFGITRTALSLDQATTEANAIFALTQTEIQYVNGLLSQVADTTIPVVAVEASMYGAVGSSAVITSLVTNFLPGQLAYANQVGLDPEVFACLETALVFAFHNEAGATTFANNFGPSNAAMPATAAGDAAFAAAAATAIFGSAQTVNTTPAILGYVNFLEGFFTANGIVGVQNPTADQIVIAARAGAWGEGVAIALENNLGGLPGQVINFLEDAAQGTAIYSASLSSQPNHAPFQGSTIAGGVQLVGLAAPIDHVAM